MHTFTALGTAERGNHILSSGRQKRPMGRSCGFSPHHGHYRTLAEWALNSAQWLQPWALPPTQGPQSAPRYSDVSVFLTSLVVAAWQLSYETITTWLSR